MQMEDTLADRLTVVHHQPEGVAVAVEVAAQEGLAPARRAGGARRVGWWWVGRMMGGVCTLSEGVRSAYSTVVLTTLCSRDPPPRNYRS